MNYTVAAIPDLFALIDSKLVDAKYYGEGTDVLKNALAREIKVTAKDKSGNDVAIPSGRILDVSSSNNSVVQAVYRDGKAMAIGNKAGSAQITVAYKTVKGETKDVVLNVNTKTDAVSVATLTAGNSKVKVASSDLTATKAYDLMDLKVVDNYGNEYTKDEIFNFKQFTGVIYTINSSDVEGTGTVSVDAQGTITYTGNVDKFILKATTGTKSVTTTVTVTH